MRVSTSCSSKRQSSTRSAFSERIAKFVPCPSQVGPSGNGVPGQTFMYGSAADRVAMHAARVRARLQLPVLVAADGADAAERPGRRGFDVVPAGAQAGERLLPGAILDGDMPRARLARIEGAWERLGVMVRRVDRGLEVHAEVRMREQRVQRPLILLVAARRSEREIGIAAAGDERRRKRRAWTLARLERVRQAFLEPEH